MRKIEGIEILSMDELEEKAHEIAMRLCNLRDAVQEVVVEMNGLAGNLQKTRLVTQHEAKETK